MDKLIKMFTKKKGKTETPAINIQQPNVLIVGEAIVTPQIKESTKEGIVVEENEILVLNSELVNSKKINEGFYYTRYIDVLNNLRMVRFV
jgi:hypothetical protein